MERGGVVGGNGEKMGLVGITFRGEGK